MKSTDSSKQQSDLHSVSDDQSVAGRDYSLNHDARLFDTIRTSRSIHSPFLKRQFTTKLLGEQNTNSASFVSKESPIKLPIISDAVSVRSENEKLRSAWPQVFLVCCLGSINAVGFDGIARLGKLRATSLFSTTALYVAEVLTCLGVPGIYYYLGQTLLSAVGCLAFSLFSLANLSISQPVWLAGPGILFGVVLRWGVAVLRVIKDSVVITYPTSCLKSFAYSLSYISIMIRVTIILIRSTLYNHSYEMYSDGKFRFTTIFNTQKDHQNKVASDTTIVLRFLQSNSYSFSDELNILHVVLGFVASTVGLALFHFFRPTKVKQCDGTPIKFIEYKDQSFMACIRRILYLPFQSKVFPYFLPSIFLNDLASDYQTAAASSSTSPIRAFEKNLLTIYLGHICGMLLFCLVVDFLPSIQCRKIKEDEFSKCENFPHLENRNKENYSETVQIKKSLRKRYTKGLILYKISYLTATTLGSIVHFYYDGHSAPDSLVKAYLIILGVCSIIRHLFITWYLGHLIGHRIVLAIYLFSFYHCLNILSFIVDLILTTLFHHFKYFFLSYFVLQAIALLILFLGVYLYADVDLDGIHGSSLYDKFYDDQLIEPPILQSFVSQDCVDFTDRSEWISEDKTQLINPSYEIYTGVSENIERDSNSLGRSNHPVWTSSILGRKSDYVCKDIKQDLLEWLLPQRAVRKSPFITCYDQNDLPVDHSVIDVLPSPQSIKSMSNVPNRTSVVNVVYGAGHPMNGPAYLKCPAEWNTNESPIYNNVTQRNQKYQTQTHTPIDDVTPNPREDFRSINKFDSSRIIAETQRWSFRKWGKSSPKQKNANNRRPELYRSQSEVSSKFVVTLREARGRSASFDLRQDSNDGESLDASFCESESDEIERFSLSSNWHTAFDQCSEDDNERSDLNAKGWGNLLNMFKSRTSGFHRVFDNISSNLRRSNKYNDRSRNVLGTVVDLPELKNSGETKEQRRSN